MPQVMDNKDVQPISDPLSDAFGWVAYVPEAIVRSLKRLFREQVTPNDYSQIWAEIREDGTIVWVLIATILRLFYAPHVFQIKMNGVLKNK